MCSTEQIVGAAAEKKQKRGREAVHGVLNAMHRDGECRPGTRY